ncbi:MAG TPA: DUF2934 domain-containing protein [Burkholderiales bacterium]|jgi:hypothetical protein|nr:DUF2934 domain-containing protein [Burkholderiales bacterium]
MQERGPMDKTMPSAAELYEMIAEAAYYRAQKRGFAPGAEAEDWLHAETEVMERVRKQYTTRNGADDGEEATRQRDRAADGRP